MYRVYKNSIIILDKNIFLIERSAFAFQVLYRSPNPT